LTPSETLFLALTKRTGNLKNHTRLQPDFALTPLSAKTENQASKIKTAEAKPGFPRVPG
jgi:hypothetical protein